MRTRFAPVAILAGLTQLWACGEFVSDAPDDANLTNADAGPRPDASGTSRPDTTPPASSAFSCADPKMSSAIFCEDFTTAMAPPRWVAVPAAMPTFIVHQTPDLLVRGTFDNPRAFYRHDFAAGVKALDLQFVLRLNAPSVGHAQVFALFPGSSRSVGFVLNGAALSVFSYDDGPGYKAGDLLLPDAHGEHTLRLVATAVATTWQFQVSVDGGTLVNLPGILGDLTVTSDVLSFGTGLVGGDAKGSVDYAIDNIVVR